jgi:hypothetical protein
MENNQNTPPKTSESNFIMPRSKRRWQHWANSNFLPNLISRRPWLLWMGIGAFLFTIIYISLLSITQTGFVKEETEPTTVVTEKPEATQTDSSVPLWVLGLVIVGGAGAIAIVKRLPSSSYLQFFQLGANSKASTCRKERKVRADCSPLLLQGKQPLPFPPPVASEQVTQTVSISVQLPEDQSLLPEPVPTEEEIIIVLDSLLLDLEEPAEQLLPDEETFTFSEERSLNLIKDSEDNNPLAASTQSLVEMLDLRRKVPLSTLLGDFQKLGGKNNI